MFVVVFVLIIHHQCHMLFLYLPQRRYIIMFLQTRYTGEVLKLYQTYYNNITTLRYQYAHA